MIVMLHRKCPGNTHSTLQDKETGAFSLVYTMRALATAGAGICMLTLSRVLSYCDEVQGAGYCGLTSAAAAAEPSVTSVTTTSPSTSAGQGSKGTTLCQCQTQGVMYVAELCVSASSIHGSQT
jgi:hypothetical protein